MQYVPEIFGEKIPKTGVGKWGLKKYADFA
jgi:hypothetical protein